MAESVDKSLEDLIIDYKAKELKMFEELSSNYDIYGYTFEEPKADISDNLPNILKNIYLLRSSYVYSLGNYVWKTDPPSIREEKEKKLLNNINAILNDVFTTNFDEIIESYPPYFENPYYQKNKNKGIEIKAKANVVVNIIEKFKEHYGKSIDLLLSGPPYANEHTINDIKAAEWINAHEQEELKRLAAILIKITRYIPHEELKTEIERNVVNLKDKIDRGEIDKSLPFIFLVSETKKSNYYISLLYYHYWMKHKLPNITYVISKLFLFEDLNIFNIKCNLFDIDDMGYSGSQTEQEMVSKLQYISSPLLCKLGLEKIIKNIGPKLSNDFASYVPLLLKKYILHKFKFNYYLVRIFCSTYALNRWKNNNIGIHSKFQCTTDLIKTIKEQMEESGRNNDKKNFAKLIYGFADQYPSTSVYFDHKVADSASTLNLALSTGLVLNRSILDKETSYKILKSNFEKNPKEFENIKKEMNALLEILNSEQKKKGIDKPLFIPFINNCTEGRKIPEIKNINDNSIYELKFDESNRCPIAWYKYINYDNGTYEPPKVGGRYYKNNTNNKNRKTGKTRKIRKIRKNKRITKKNNI